MKIYLIAVEPSADQLGADLATELRAALPDLRLAGIGGRRMQAAGIPSQMDVDGLAILGITEALKKLPLVYRKIAEAADRVEAAKPDAVIFLDSYGFMVRLAGAKKRVAGLGDYQPGFRLSCERRGCCSRSRSTFE